MAKEQSNVCAVCGRRARRVCPALAGMICPACCGSRRGTKIECPPDCTYFPFGTEAYDLWLKIDSAWQPKALNYVLRRIGREEFASTAEELCPNWINKDQAFEEGAVAALLFYLAINEDCDLPLGEIWEKEGWPGLNNDERFMAEYRTRSLPGILEVQRVLDDTAIECIDHLDKERGKFIVFDRSTAGTAVRFLNVVVWLTHYPHFSRLAGNGVILPNELVETFLSIIRERTEKTFERESDDAVKHYLAESFGGVYDLVESLIEERRERMLDSMDADQCSVTYELQAPREDIEAILDEKPDFDLEEDRELEPGGPPDATHYNWFRRGEAKRIEQQIPGLIKQQGVDDSTVGGLGFVRLTDGEFRFTTMGRQKFEFAKELIGSYFTNMLKLVNEEIIPLKELMDEVDGSESGPPDPSEEISKEVEEEVLRKFYAQQYKQFLDEPVPMINNLTPREAAKTPAMRPKLIELIKLHLKQIDSQCIEKGIDINIDWVLDELELEELR